MAVLVTGDTGPLHLAIALQVPTVSLFVTANPKWTGPYQDPIFILLSIRSRNKMKIEHFRWI